MQEKRQRYEECLIAFSTGALEAEEAQQLHRVREKLRAEFLDAKRAFEEASQ